MARSSAMHVHTAARGPGPGIMELPEINVALFAFLLNFVWEFWQVPFFQGMPTAPHWEAIKFCTRATVGDAAIALVAFWAVAATHSRNWILHPSTRAIVSFTSVGLAITVVAEWVFTEVFERWAYAASMPILPVLGTGVTPVLQWILLPPLIVWFVHRQLT